MELLEKKIRNEYLSGSIGVVSLVDKLCDNRLRWLWHGGIGDLRNVVLR